MDSSGNVYVADAGNSIIRKITPSGVVATMIGNAASQDVSLGFALPASLTFPLGVAIGPSPAGSNASGTAEFITTINGVVWRYVP